MTNQEKKAREELRDMFVLYRSQHDASLRKELAHDYVTLCTFVEAVFPNINIDACENVWNAKIKKGEL